MQALGGEILRAEGVGVCYGNLWAIRGICLKVSAGERVAIIGPNGAGKSTLLRVIAGVQRLTTGELTWLRSDIRVGYVPQKLAFDARFPITVEEFLAMGLPSNRIWPWVMSHGVRDAVHEAARLLGLERLMRVQLGRLSGGEQQRLFIAAALMDRPEVLLLDEPSASIDRQGICELIELLLMIQEASGMTLIFVSHDWHFIAGLAGRVICLNQTVCADGAPHDVLGAEHFELSWGGDYREGSVTKR